MGHAGVRCDDWKKVGGSLSILYPWKTELFQAVSFMIHRLEDLLPRIVNHALIVILHDYNPLAFVGPSLRKEYRSERPKVVCPCINSVRHTRSDEHVSNMRHDSRRLLPVNFSRRRIRGRRA